MKEIKKPWYAKEGPRQLYLKRMNSVFPKLLSYGAGQSQAVKKAGKSYLQKYAEASKVLSQPPPWMSEAARGGVFDIDMEVVGVGAWWSNTLKLLGAPELSIEASAVIMGMATFMGWPMVVAAALAEGAMVATGAPKGDGRKDGKWRYVGPEDKKDDPTTAYRSALNYGVLGICMEAGANRPINPDQMQALKMLLDAGSSPNDLSVQANKKALKYPPVAFMLLSYGWDVASTSRKIDRDPIYAYLFSPRNTTSINCRKTILKAILKQGFPLYPEGEKAPSILDIMVRSASGIRCAGVVIDHFGEAAVASLLGSRGKIERLVRRMSNGEAILSKIDESLLDGTVAGASATVPRRRI
jgi:hypothetical protein